jgi:hypothetical protein
LTATLARIYWFFPGSREYSVVNPKEARHRMRRLAQSAVLSALFLLGANTAIADAQYLSPMGPPSPTVQPAAPQPVVRPKSPSKKNGFTLNELGVSGGAA